MPEEMIRVVFLINLTAVLTDLKRILTCWYRLEVTTCATSCRAESKGIANTSKRTKFLTTRKWE